MNTDGLPVEIVSYCRPEPPSEPENRAAGPAHAVKHRGSRVRLAVVWELGPVGHRHRNRT